MLWRILLIYYLGLSLLSAAMHLYDKRQAVRGRRRIRENTLHSFELLGGWPGALLTMRAIGHKVNKPRYMWTIYGFALLHVLGWFALMWIATR